jgi:putative transposase
MTEYRRAYIPGESYFFTVVLADRHSTLLKDHVALLRDCFRSVRNRHPFIIDAIVILPDRLHCVWMLPDGDSDFSFRWSRIKAELSRAIDPGERRRASRIKRGERGIRQRRFWEHLIRDERDFRHHVDYIHFNPIKHGYVSRAIE